jgi:hypothetical protein
LLNCYLTPKGLNVRTTDKLVLVCVTSAHTIFRFFETFREHASHSKLRGIKKMHFLDLRIKSYGCLKFQGEVWAGGQNRGAPVQGRSPTAGCPDPATTGRLAVARRATVAHSGRRRAVARRHRHVRRFF